MKKVLTSLEEAARLVQDGDLVTFGGATFHRAPMEFVRELVRQEKKELNLIDREPAMDFDLLIGAGCVAKVRTGMLAFEVFGMAPNFRKKSEKGEIVTKEGACQPIIAGFRAAGPGLVANAASLPRWAVRLMAAPAMWPARIPERLSTGFQESFSTSAIPGLTVIGAPCLIRAFRSRPGSSVGRAGD